MWGEKSWKINVMSRCLSSRPNKRQTSEVCWSDDALTLKWRGKKMSFQPQCNLNEIWLPFGKVQGVSLPCACEAWFLWPSFMLALCLSAPFLLFLSVPCLSFCLFHSSMFWWRRMVLHVLVKGLAVWDFRCYGSSYMNGDDVIWFKMGQIVVTDHISVLFQIRWVQVATQDSTRAKVHIIKAICLCGLPSPT